MTSELYLSVVAEIDRLQDERAEIATRWARDHRALEAARRNGTAPSKVLDAEAELQALSRLRDGVDHRLVVATNRRKALDRDRAAIVRSGLLDRYLRQTRELGITIATLIELDGRMGNAIPDCAGLGRLYVPSWANMPCSSDGAILTLLDVQGMALAARKETDLLMARQEADVVQPREVA